MVLWGLADNEGTIRDVVSNAGATMHVQFDSYGDPIGSTTPATTGFLFGLNGMPWDPATQEYQAGAVPYDPFTGERLCEDPLGFASGTTNLSDWCGNDPVGRVDPTGEDCGAASAASRQRAGILRAHTGVARCFTAAACTVPSKSPASLTAWRRNSACYIRRRVREPEGGG